MKLSSIINQKKIHKKYGSLPIKKLISPAIELAEKGFILSKFQAEYFNSNRDKFSKNPETKKISCSKAEGKLIASLVKKELSK